MNLIKLYNDFNQNMGSPIENQKKILSEYLVKFRVRSYEEFISNYSISDYKYLKKRNFYGLEEECEYYVKTSGTNTPSKYIPISSSFLDSNHFKCARYVLFNLVVRHGAVTLLGGKNIALSGYKYHEAYHEKPIYDISALMFLKRPSIYKSVGYPKGVFYSWKEKLNHFDGIFDLLSKAKSISGVPTWMISLFSHLEKNHNKKIHTLLPNLSYIIHGGVNFDNYYPIFEKAFPDRELHFFETYNSTEGFHGFQLFQDRKELLLCTNTGIFYEFMDDSGVYPIWGIKEGKEYEVIMTSEDGVVRYRTGDVIKILSLLPVMFIFVGRSSEYINAFGEDLEVSQTNKVVASICEEQEIDIFDYFVVPRYSDINNIGTHEWYIFSTSEGVNKDLLKSCIDSKLIRINNNYKQKRMNSSGMGEPVVHLLDILDYEKIIKVQKKEGGGQSKLKRLHNDRKILSIFGEYFNYSR